MTTLTDLQTAVLEVVRRHTKGHVITGRKIAMAVGLKPRDTGKEGADLRSIVNALRRKGYPICANNDGYYYPVSKTEVVEYMASLRGRIEKAQEALDGIDEGLEHWETVATEPDVIV